MLRSVEWQYFTDVSGQRIGAISFLDVLTVEDGTDMFVVPKRR
jgi:hypothetical protein